MQTLGAQGDVLPATLHQQTEHEHRRGCCGHQEREERVELQETADVERGQARLVLVETDRGGLDVEPRPEALKARKRVYDGDRGPNTGGMGAYAPAPVASERDFQRVIREILVPTVHAMNKEKRRFRGILYAGIMYTKSGPKVLEYNVRFGDPECQPLMMMLKSDLIPIMEAVIDDKLGEVDVTWDPRPAVCVVMASGGYPGSYETGYPITGIDAAEAGGAAVFHGGTSLKDGKLVSAGGRVLGVTAQGKDLREAQANAYAAVKKIEFKAAHYRKDIAAKCLTPA